MDSTIDEILSELRAGRMIVLVDDEQRENEGDLVCAAEHVTPDGVNFMVSQGRGLLCVALDGSICDRLELLPQTRINTSPLSTGYTITVDAARQFGVSTGVSAADRATTIRRLADSKAVPEDFARPGHVQPLRARRGGVLVRTGQTEGGVDLCRLAGLQPAAAIIEVMNPDGTMARLPELRQFCDQHQIKLCSVASIIAHRLSREQLVERVDEVPFETSGGSFRLLVYRSAVDALPHVVLCKGRVGREPIDEPVLVRVHSQNLLGDVFDDATDPSGRRLAAAMRKINEAGEGAVVYLRTEGSGSGLLQRLQTLHDREGGGEDAEAERAAVRRAAGMFDYGIGSQILRDLGVRRLRLMTDHPMQLHALQGFELELTEFIPLIDRPAD